MNAGLLLIMVLFFIGFQQATSLWHIASVLGVLLLILGSVWTVNAIRDYDKSRQLRTEMDALNARFDRTITETSLPIRKASIGLFTVRDATIQTPFPERNPQ